MDLDGCHASRDGNVVPHDVESMGQVLKQKLSRAAIEFHPPRQVGSTVSSEVPEPYIFLCRVGKGNGLRARVVIEIPHSPAQHLTGAKLSGAFALAFSLAIAAGTSRTTGTSDDTPKEFCGVKRKEQRS
jgi:hypothetical protein